MQLDLQGPGAEAGKVCGAQKTGWTRNDSRGGGVYGAKKVRGALQQVQTHSSLKGGGAAWKCASRSAGASATHSRSFRSATHLEDIGLDPATGQEGLDLRQAEVADADGPHQPGVNQCLHRRPAG